MCELLATHPPADFRSASISSTPSAGPAQVGSTLRTAEVVKVPEETGQESWDSHNVRGAVQFRGMDGLVVV